MAARGEIVAYFGYGSLVNPATHRTATVHCERAHLRGYRRAWQERPDEAEHPIALLTAAPEPDEAIELSGLIVFDRAENLPAVDEREAGYDRLALAPDRLRLDRPDAALPDMPIYVYRARAPARPETVHHILQSYLDAVLQGYLHQFGPEGARAFVRHTARFDTPVLRDRDEPLYPRAVRLSGDERGFIDALTADLRLVDGFV